MAIDMKNLLKVLRAERDNLPEDDDFDDDFEEDGNEFIYVRD